jgi:hypothetical protein
MACYNPLRAYRSKHLNENGKRPIVWKENLSDGSGEIQLPCGRCKGCRLEYSRQWALRCHHEAQMYSDNAFITLTYAPEHLPDDYSIHKSELQKFFKRLRKTTGKKIRYFACGEYGEKGNRPHYHAIIFGYDFPDKVLYSQTSNGDNLYRSPTLEKVWKKGFSLIGNVTFESAAYVARYVMKKRKGKPDQVDKYGKKNSDYYLITDKDTGEVFQQNPEFAIMSRGKKSNDDIRHQGGIGYAWFKTYKGDTDKDYVTLATGGKYKLPKYYDVLLEREDPFAFEERKDKRKENTNPLDNTMERLRVKEKVKTAQIQNLNRSYENVT